MRKISEVVEDIKSILNNIERTEECTGETLVDINELVDEILTISCIDTTIDTTEIRNKAIDEFVERLEKHEQENWIDHHEYGITWSDIDKIAKEMKGGGNIDN